jgi:hypothetical protein
LIGFFASHRLDFGISSGGDACWGPQDGWQDGWIATAGVPALCAVVHDRVTAPEAAMKSPAAGCIHALLLMGVFWLVVALVVVKLWSIWP